MDDRNNQLIILGHVCKFALKCKNLYRIGPRKSVKIFTGLTPGRTGAKSGEVFSRLEGGEGQSQGSPGSGWRAEVGEGQSQGKV